MSSFPGTTPSTLPPAALIAERPYAPEEKENKALERRSASPREQTNRRLFERVYQYVRRYSKEPQDMIPEEVRHHLQTEVEDLKNQDALIQLSVLEKKGEICPEKEDLWIGVYRLMHPAIKQLNDIYLGPNQTDDFIFEDLSSAITKLLDKNNDQMLHSNFKGGVFVINFTELANGSGRSAPEILEEKLEDIHHLATEILLEHIKKRVLMLEIKKETLKDSVANGEIIHEKEVDAVFAQIRKIEQNIEELDVLSLGLKTGAVKIDIAFGFDKLRSGLHESFLSVRNAETAANMATIDARENGHRKAKMYSNKELMVEAIQTLQLVGSFDLLDGNNIREEWKNFFYIDARGYIRMHPDMIKTYRRIEKYRRSSEYLNMSIEQRRAFDGRIEKFGQYYTRINMVDVLKKFVRPDMETYLERVDALASLIIEAEKALNRRQDDPMNINRCRRLLEAVSLELEISLKDKGAEIVSTTRAGIRQMLEPGQKLILFTDNIGFGAINQASYEKSLLDLVELLQISDAEWENINGSRQKLETLVEKKLAGFEETPEFINALLDIGDAGTRYLRDNEEKAHQLFGGHSTIDAEGGDETKIYFPYSENPDIPENEEELERRLLQFSMETRMRIAAVLTDFTFTPIDNGIINDQQRSEILQYIGMTTWAEYAHEKIKDLNAQGDHKVELKHV